MLNRTRLLVLLVLGMILYILGIVLLARSLSLDNTPAPGALVTVFGGLLIGMIGWIGTLVRQAKQKQLYWFLATLLAGLLVIPILGGFIMTLIYLLIPEKPLPAVAP